jgi:hypothetical protein
MSSTSHKICTMDTKMDDFFLLHLLLRHIRQTGNQAEPSKSSPGSTVDFQGVTRRYLGKERLKIYPLTRRSPWLPKKICILVSLVQDSNSVGIIRVTHQIQKFIPLGEKENKDRPKQSKMSHAVSKKEQKSG